MATETDELFVIHAITGNSLSFSSYEETAYRNTSGTLIVGVRKNDDFRVPLLEITAVNADDFSDELICRTSHDFAMKLHGELFELDDHHIAFAFIEDVTGTNGLQQKGLELYRLVFTRDGNVWRKTNEQALPDGIACVSPPNE